MLKQQIYGVQSIRDVMVCFYKCLAMRQIRKSGRCAQLWYINTHAFRIKFELVRMLQDMYVSADFVDVVFNFIFIVAHLIYSNL